MLLLVLLSGVASLHAQMSPYEYGKRWYVSLQGGPVYFNGDWSHLFREYKGEWLTPVMPAFGTSLGYSFANGHELRLTATYGKKKATCISPNYNLLYPYSFHSVSFFADYVLSFRALGETFYPFSPNLYVGPGVAYTFGFSDPNHPLRVVNDPNWAGGLNMGTILEYNFPSGFGLFADLGMSFWADPYDGQGWFSFVLDMDVGVYFGVVYHFQRRKR